MASAQSIMHNVYCVAAGPQSSFICPRIARETHPHHPLSSRQTTPETAPAWPLLFLFYRPLVFAWHYERVLLVISNLSRFTFGMHSGGILGPQSLPQVVPRRGCRFQDLSPPCTAQHPGRRTHRQGTRHQPPRHSSFPSSPITPEFLLTILWLQQLYPPPSRVRGAHPGPRAVLGVAAVRYRCR